MIRIRATVLPGVALAFTATCSSSPPSAPTDPDPPKVQPTTDLTAVSLGVTIDARDERGKPRLIRAIVPRQAAVGMKPEEAARDHLAALKPLWLSNQRASDLATQSTQILRNGASVVRVKQMINNVELHQSELHVLVQRDGSLGAVAGTMRPGAGRTTFRSTAAAALDGALDALYGKTRARPAITEGTERDGYRELTVAATPQFRVTAARAKRELMPEGDHTYPIWSVELFAEKPGLDNTVEPAARRVLIADGDGRVVRNVNLTASDAFVYRVFADATGTRIPLDGALESFNPHPTGTPDGSAPGAATQNIVVMEAFNGPRDPWLGNDATTTSGNNVDAFADIAPPTGLSPGDIRPEVREGRTLNYRYDFTAEPLSSDTQSKAATVNLFFVQNWLHDWYYDSGFTEATGNAQVDNLGRGGIGGDPIIAHAQANALGGSRDNANMATPEDGLSPVTNMFLWSGKATTGLATPSGTPGSVGFVTGPRNFEFTGEVVLATNSDDGRHTACTPVNADVAGKIAVFEFTNEDCGSLVSVDNVKAAGAVGVIAIIAVPGSPAVSLNGSPAANIPGVIIGDSDGKALEAALPVTVTMTRTTTLEHDGDFDNAIIAHEWGHYLHHRLASCEEASQCNAMSEGWGDFNALLMMLRDSDNRDGTFATGLYALLAGGLVDAGFTDPGYFGIRRFPYSTNRAKNALSFRHIGDDAALPDVATNPGPSGGPNSEVHNAGEIWATMMWEAYNVLLDQHPFAEAHRRMTDYVVAGLLLTPPEATYTEARDAILAAAGALDTDDMILMAAAFAGRGAGTCAVSPARGSVEFTGVVESGTIAAKLESSSATVSDDGVSCDHDGYLDPGESGTIHITVANSGVIAAESIVVTATSSTPGVTIGKKIEVGNVAALSHVDVAIPIKLSATAPLNSTLELSIKIEGDAGCNTGKLAVALRAPIGVDEQAQLATTDTIETKLVAWTPTGLFGGDLWSRTTDASGNHVLFGIDAPFISDTQLVSPVLQASATAPLVVTLKHAFNLESIPGIILFDGGVIEVSNDGGTTWRDVTEVGVDPGYTGPLPPEFGNPLGGRDAFSDINASFPNREALTLDFGTQFAGQSVMLRFRLGTDVCCAAQGWEIDDISVSGITNTPFPGFVPEPTRCVGGTPTGRSSDEGSVIGVHSMPRNSLAGVPGVNTAL